MTKELTYIIFCCKKLYFYCINPLPVLYNFIKGRALFFDLFRSQKAQISRIGLTKHLFGCKINVWLERKSFLLPNLLWEDLADEYAVFKRS